MTRDRDAEAISVRRWADIRSAWLDYIPEHNPPWPVPQHEIFELSSLARILEAFPKDHRRDITKETVEEEIKGLRKAVLHQAVILMHKAANVLRATADEAERGYRTWSRSSAYHSAFFSMRAVLGFMGIVVFRHRDRRKDYQLDLWAPRVQRTVSGVDCDYAVRVMPRGGVQHKELWSIFHRVLCASRIDPGVWPYAGNDVLKRLTPQDFSKVRHTLHYRSAGWLFNDLDVLTPADDLDGLAFDVVNLTHLSDPEHSDFPLSLAIHILSLAVALVTDLGRDAPKLATEAERAEAWMLSAPWKCANVFTHTEN